MGVLVFVCPATGDTVSTNLEIDGGSFSSLSSQRFSQVRCPRCAEPHDLSKIANWLIRLWTPTQGVIEVSASSSPEVFWATTGGMGLTGIVLDATIRIRALWSPRACRWTSTAPATSTR